MVMWKEILRLFLIANAGSFLAACVEETAKETVL